MHVAAEATVTRVTRFVGASTRSSARVRDAL
jgi:hypothetical protein